MIIKTSLTFARLSKTGKVVINGEIEEEFNDYQDIIDVRKTTYYKRERSGSLPAKRVSDMTDSLLTESAEIEHDHEHAEKLILGTDSSSSSTAQSSSSSSSSSAGIRARHICD